MGKFGLSQRVGNTIVTPLRIGGEVVNAGANIPRQGLSAIKNIAEVGKQTGNALLRNFLDFSKVQGKRYQKLLKVPFNLASAVTRRPAMIAGTGALSALNQGIRQPFKKLLYTPGKMFKGMRNATRIFSKKKGFDFQTYDTHETGDIRITNNKNFGFLGAKGGSEKIPEVKKEKPKKADKKPEKKSEPKPEIVAPTLSTTTSKSKDKPTSINEIHQQRKEESASKDAAEQAKKFPQRNTLHYEKKAELAKEFKKKLGVHPTKESIIERGKINKKGDTIEEIMSTIKKDYPTMAGYIEEEILNQAA